MTGTTFRTGVSTKKDYSGNVDTTNNYDTAVQTKPIRRTAVIHCIGSEADNSERTTAFTFPAKVLVHDVYLNVITADATETVNVGTEGTSNDPNGFLAAVSLASTGIVKGSIANGAVTAGALLVTEIAGVASYAFTDCITCGSDPVSFTCSAGTDTAVFDIIIEYTEIE